MKNRPRTGKKLPKRPLLEMARKVYARPTRLTADTVREEASQAYFSGLISRDEHEIAEILVETLERCFR